jgi:hypothetical protein
MRCVWQLSGGQWRMSSVQRSADSGSAAPEPSVAWPANVSVSPTARWRLAAGESIVTVGGVPTVMRRVAVPLAPFWLVTRSRTVT